MVERTHEILNGIAGDQCNAVWNRISASDVIDRLSRLRITLGPDLIRLSVQEGTMLSLQISDVLFGPFDF